MKEITKGNEIHKRISSRCSTYRNIQRPYETPSLRSFQAQKFSKWRTRWTIQVCAAGFVSAVDTPDPENGYSDRFDAHYGQFPQFEDGTAAFGKMANGRLV